MYTLPLTLIAGTWISIAPFIMQTQPAASAWSTATINDVVAGGIVAVRMYETHARADNGSIPQGGTPQTGALRAHSPGLERW